MNKKLPGRGPAIFAWILAAAAGVGNLLVHFMRDSIIVETGIRSFRTIEYGAFITLVVLAVLAIIVTLVTALERRSALKAEEKEQQENLARQAEAERKIRRKESPLAVSDRLDPPTLQNGLRGAMSSTGGEVNTLLGTILKQMNRMDELQARHETLLKNNAAYALSDTADILDQVEQYMCRNVRKVLNYVSVLDPSDPQDRGTLVAHLKECAELNGEQLKKTQDFLVALTEFLNRQGDGKGGSEALDMYKETILKAIR